MRPMQHRWLLLAAIAAVSVAVTPARSRAAVPEAVGYQGTLTDAGGVLVTAALPFTFRIYADEVGGSSIWEETHPSVDVLEGSFTVILGSTEPLTAAVFSGSSDLWLGIQVDIDTEMAPRQLVASVPFALHAGVAMSAIVADSALRADDADTVGGSTVGAIEATMDAKIVGHASLPGAHHAPKTAVGVRTDVNTDITHGTSATHNYFTQADAITAMSAKADNNPLHHDRYMPVIFQDSANGSITTNATSFTATDLSLTPGAGDYLVWFSASVRCDAANSLQIVVLYANGTQVGYTQRRFFTEQSIPNTEVPIAFQARVLGLGAGQTLEVRWQTTAGTARMYNRTLTAMRY